MRYVLAAVVLAVGIGFRPGSVSAEWDDFSSAYSSGYNSYQQDFNQNYGGMSSPSADFTQSNTTFQAPTTFNREQVFESSTQSTTTAGGAVSVRSARQEMFNAASVAATAANTGIGAPISPNVAPPTFSGGGYEDAMAVGAGNNQFLAGQSPTASVEGGGFVSNGKYDQTDRYDFNNYVNGMVFKFNKDNQGGDTTLNGYLNASPAERQAMLERQNKFNAQINQIEHDYNRQGAGYHEQNSRQQTQDLIRQRR